MSESGWEHERARASKETARPVSPAPGGRLWLVGRSGERSDWLTDHMRPRHLTVKLRIIPPGLKQECSIKWSRYFSRLRRNLSFYWFIPLVVAALSLGTTITSMRFSSNFIQKKLISNLLGTSLVSYTDLISALVDDIQNFQFNVAGCLCISINRC